MTKHSDLVAFDIKPMTARLIGKVAAAEMRLGTEVAKDFPAGFGGLGLVGLTQRRPHEWVGHLLYRRVNDDETRLRVTRVVSGHPDFVAAAAARLQTLGAARVGANFDKGDPLAQGFLEAGFNAVERQVGKVHRFEAFLNLDRPDDELRLVWNRDPQAAWLDTFLNVREPDC